MSVSLPSPQRLYFEADLAISPCCRSSKISAQTVQLLSSNGAGEIIDGLLRTALEKVLPLSLLLPSTTKCSHRFLVQCQPVYLGIPTDLIHATISSKSLSTPLVSILNLASLNARTDTTYLLPFSSLDPTRLRHPLPAVHPLLRRWRPCWNLSSTCTLKRPHPSSSSMPVRVDLAWKVWRGSS
jgi:hypothetical protein